MGLAVSPRGPPECTERALRNCWLNELRMGVELGRSECTGLAVHSLGELRDLGGGDVGRICCACL